MEYPTIKLNKLKPHPENPKEHSPEQVEEIGELIINLDWGRPIIISNDYFILAGHGAWEAAELIGDRNPLGKGIVPYKMMKWRHDDPEAIAYMLADNRSAEKSHWNTTKLEMVGKGLKLKNFNLELTGFNPLELGVKGTQLGELKDKYNKEDGQAGSLREDFIIPPFSLFDTTRGEWRQRKEKWLKIIGDTGQTRDDVVLGQLGTSIFDPVLAEIIIKWFTPNGGSICDPFAGGIFGFVAGYLGHEFTGIELREEQARLNQKRCNEKGLPSTYINDDAVNILNHMEPDTRDLVFSCPPYYDLEVYSDLPNDASNQNTYEEFLEILTHAYTGALKVLKNNRFACIVVGDIRDQNGYYRRFPDDIKNIFTSNGAALYNEAIIINSVGTGAIRARQTFKNRKLVKLHQNLLIFYKGQPQEIQAILPEKPAIMEMGEE